MARPPPGPRGEHLGKLNYRAWKEDAFGFLKTLADQYGDVVGFDLGRSPCILVNGAPEVRELLLDRESQLRKPEFVKDSNRGHWGDGLTTLEGDDWRSRRQILRRSFSGRRLSSRLSVAAQCAADMLVRWAPSSEGDLLRELRILTARIAARLVLDADLEGCPGEGRAGVLPFPEAYGESYSSAPGGDLAAPLVMARLPDGARLAREDIVGEVIQMLYAGHLTIPSTLLNFWRDIASNELAERISAEANDLCRTGAPDPLSLSRSYCLAALKESMRLHPPAPLLYREVTDPFELHGFEFP